VPATGRYALWLRGFWFVVPLKWRWNEGEWHEIHPDNAQYLDFVRVRQVWLNNAWAHMGDVHLNEGRNTLDLAVPGGGQYSLALDCWVLTSVPFEPSGSTRPDGATAARAQPEK